MLGMASVAFTAWAGLVGYFGKRLVGDNAEMRERIVKLETVVFGRGIPPPEVENALKAHKSDLSDHETRLRALEGNSE